MGEARQEAHKNQLFYQKKKVTFAQIYICISQCETAAGILSCALHSPYCQVKLCVPEKSSINLPFLASRNSFPEYSMLKQSHH